MKWRESESQTCTLSALQLMETRFRLKFHKIVEDEKDSNFITRLHAGKLDIMPWPVIGSKEFYQFLKQVKVTLNEEPTSHHTAGGFLFTLKTLMAKLKVRFRHLHH